MCSAACSLRDRLLEEGLCPSRGATSSADRYKRLLGRPVLGLWLPGPVAVRIDASDYSAIAFLALMSGRFTVHLLAPWMRKLKKITWLLKSSSWITSDEHFHNPRE